MESEPLTPKQLQALGGLLHMAFKEIRTLASVLFRYYVLLINSKHEY